MTEELLQKLQHAVLGLYKEGKFTDTEMVVIMKELSEIYTIKEK